MSYEQWIALAIAREENHRDLFPDPWDEPHEDHATLPAETDASNARV